MRVAILTLTRDRLEYTKHCFAQLEKFAGIDYDHYVLDQGSTDGTQEWLRNEYAPEWIDLRPDNIGISRGINALIDETRKHDDYDFIVKFDNDCELVTPRTLTAACLVAQTGEWIVSPHIQGLNDPPNIERDTTVAGYRIGVPPIIGGIFMCAPASVYDSYRHSEANPIWGMDDVALCGWWKSRGNYVGYLLDYPAWHYETTKGQQERYPEYFDRKMAEFSGR